VPGVGGAPPSPWEHLNDPQPEPVEGRTTQPLPASGSSTPPRWLSLVRSPHRGVVAPLWEQHHAPQAEPVEARTPSPLPHGRDPSPFPPLRGGPLPSPSRGEGARVPSRRQRVPGRTAQTALPRPAALGPHCPAAPPSPHRPRVQASRRPGVQASRRPGVHPASTNANPRQRPRGRAGVLSGGALGPCAPGAWARAMYVMYSGC